MSATLKKIGDTFDQLPAYESTDIHKTCCPDCDTELNSIEHTIEFGSSFAIYECDNKSNGCERRFMLLKEY